MIFYAWKQTSTAETRLRYFHSGSSRFVGNTQLASTTKTTYWANWTQLQSFRWP